MFTRSGSTWSQQAYLKANNPDANDLFGHAVSVSGDGSMVAVGAIGEQGNGTGVNAEQNNNANNSGAVYVFTRDGSDWTQRAFVKASNTEAQDSFGHQLSLSGDGNTLAVTAVGEDSQSSGFNGDQADNSAVDAGAVYVFTRSGSDWAQQAYLKASNTDAGDQFGMGLSLSDNGDLLAVGAPQEASSATGLNGNQNDNTAPAGAVYMFRRTGTDWAQQAYLKASNTDPGDAFGRAVGLSGDGQTLAVGATGEQSTVKGTQASASEQADNSVPSRGAVYLYWPQAGPPSSVGRLSSAIHKTQSLPL